MEIHMIFKINSEYTLSNLSIIENCDLKYFISYF